eukprot:2278487-Alexandrium_andersonii.AAC.1
MTHFAIGAGSPTLSTTSLTRSLHSARTSWPVGRASPRPTTNRPPKTAAKHGAVSAAKCGRRRSLRLAWRSTSGSGCSRAAHSTTQAV